MTGSATRSPTLSDRVERLWSRKLGWALVAVGVLGALIVFVARRTYPNYDTYYTLVWGQELFHGHLPSVVVRFNSSATPPMLLVAADRQDGSSADISRGVDGTSRTEIGGPPSLYPSRSSQVRG